MNFEEIVKTWWFSGLVLALIINLVAAYLKAPLDRFWASIPVATKGVLSKISATAKARIETDEKRTAARIQYLLDHPEKIVVLQGIARERKLTWFLLVVLAGTLVILCLELLTSYTVTVPVATTPFPDNFRSSLQLFTSMLSFIAGILVAASLPMYFKWWSLARLMSRLKRRMKTDLLLTPDNDIESW